MFLAFKLSNLVTIPFGWLLSVLYRFTDSYGVAMILFGVLVQFILLPLTMKSKKGMMGMSRLQPRLMEIQKKYPDDQLKQSEAMRALYKEEGVSMSGGCLWSFIPLLILIPLFQVIREPITYILMEGPEVAQQIVDIIKTAVPGEFSNNYYYDQVIAAQLIPQFAEEIKAAIPAVTETTLAGVNFTFLGINLGYIPQFNIFGWTAYDWAHIGLFIIPLLSTLSQVVSMWLMQKQNDSVITNEKGVQDEEMAKQSQAAQTNKIMMWMMPIMNLWIGFTVPAALSLYWLISGAVRTAQDVVLTKRYRKIYDAEDAIRLQKAMEQDRIEAEKERVRAERRAANPEGITTNTSKKKLQKAEREKEAAEKAAAAREYAEKKGILVEEEEVHETMSGIAERPYCKGRAYDPDRYTTED